MTVAHGGRDNRGASRTGLGLRGAAPAPVPGGGRAAEADQPEGDGVAEIVDDDDADDPGEEAAPEGATKAEGLKREAVSREILLTHLPNNPRCRARQWAKTLRAQQRQKLAWRRAQPCAVVSTALWVLLSVELLLGPRSL